MQAFLGTPAVVRSPKSALLEALQTRGVIPKFEVQQKPQTQCHLPTFVCRVTIAPLRLRPDGKQDQTVFTAEASTKKLAEQAAAEQALDYLRSRGAVVPPYVSAATHTGSQQQLPLSGQSHPQQAPPDLHSMPQVTTRADAAAPQPVGLSPPAGAAPVAGPAPPDPLQQPGTVANDAAASTSAQPSAHADKGPAAELDKLQPEDIKQLLIQAQQRVHSLETQLGKYCDWHRRMRELALEEIA